MPCPSNSRARKRSDAGALSSDSPSNRRRAGRAAALLLAVSLAACDATPVPDRLSDLDATYAMQERFGLGDVMVFLGSCIGAKNPTYPGQAACTVAIRSNGHGSETQADFHWNGKKWVAEPTQSQDLLPDPDPRLAEWVK
ncbi:hypothetical protein [Burkholderia cepacia]|uniref:hypothetical protein n=1 Tax=Burkholderia cepacia TaxID=292 RepID=UPI001C935314|nr:hypothetical protein [Burkholderia cepacia]MBY4713588.1 hypothetical protein [Burkholderia cepacia]MBY4741397.1 hypothetical protein [Burkholderia cepacia]MBY4748827.1 hypothetical protein [Burkholderia cepacia]MBY4760963.1 hypothetical protein [Burkholderia cepacia]MBY4779033.1 hypothetical protein [Burkholderia cepacia]